MKSKSTASIAVDVPATVTHEGKIYKVSDRKIMGNFLCVGKDANGNPKSRFVKTVWLKPKNFLEEQEKLEAEYDSVVMAWAWDVTSLFREVINKGSREKDIEELALQREFKDGKWSDISPIDIEAELRGAEAADDSKSTTMGKTVKKVVNVSKLKLAAIYALIVAFLAALIAGIARLVR
jgi:hypothetical protein